MPMFGPDSECSLKEEHRRPELIKLHHAADCADYAGVEEFVEHYLPRLNQHTPIELWALTGILFSRRFGMLAKFTAYYAERAEAAVTMAQAEETDPFIFMPSPILLWGRWCERYGYREGYNKGWDAGAKKPVWPSLTVTAKPVTAKPVTAKPVTAKPVTAKPNGHDPNPSS